MADYAFETDNPGLWSSFIATHNPHRSTDERGPDDLRRHMREQTWKKPEFMREWAKRNRTWEASHHEWRERRYRSVSRRKRRERVVAENDSKYLQDNYALIESGQHFGWLYHFAKLYLMNPGQISEKFEDTRLPEKALQNCLPFIEPKLPSLQKLAEMQCSSKGLKIEIILYAACLAIFRSKGHLYDVSRKALVVLKAGIDMGYSAVDHNEKESMEKEVDRRIFKTVADVKAFAREYIEPQLRIEGCQHPKVGWLRYKSVFEPLRAQYSLDWLKQNPGLSFQAMDTLFDLSANYSDRTELLKLIIQRCDEFLTSWPEKTDDEDLEQRRLFWFLRHFFFIDDVSDVIWAWLRSDPEMIFSFESIAGRLNRGDNAGWPNLSATKIYRILDAFVEKWPKVDLPNSWGTGSPKEETAYRFLTDIIWQVGNDEPGRSLPVLDRILSDGRFGDFYMVAQNLRATAMRKLALRDFAPPTPAEVVGLLDQNAVATVEGLRALLLEELEELQRAIIGSEFNPVEKFYDGGNRVDENPASRRIAEHLQLRLKPLNMAITIEHQLKDANRCDITATAMLGGSRKLLVMEVKGQWHRDLFTAAAAQLHERYSIHPDAEQQGIYLVLWFGNGENIAGKKDATISSPDDLNRKVVESVPIELRGRIDVFVLDLSKT